MQKFSLEDLNAIDGVGDKVAEALFEWFNDKKNIDFLKKLQTVGVKLKVEGQTKIGDKLKDLTFVITGTLPSLSRDAARDLIKQNGGHVSSAVSKKTDFVLAGTEPGSKYEKAEKLGVKIIGENDLTEMVQG